MFEHIGSSQHQVIYQRIATRFYLVVLFISIVIFSFYLLLNEDQQQKTIRRPSEFQFKELEVIYSSNLYCPCSTVSMSYLTFTTIEHYFHQICSSDLISDAWISYTKGDNTMNDYLSVMDYRNGGVFHFQLLAMLCQHAQQTVDTSMKTLLQTQFLSSQSLSQNRFETEVSAFINNWKTQTINQFLETFKIFEEVSHGNQFMSQQFRYYIYYRDPSNIKMSLAVQNNFNCSCSLSPSCLFPIGVYEGSSEIWEIYVTNLIVPNFFMGCSQIKGLMKSTLECFYNLSCMIELDRYFDMPLGSSFNFSNLNDSLSSPNETVESMINKLMIHSWTGDVSFSSYYSTCSPSLCTYEYIGRNDLFFVITRILGILGGLSLGLKLLTLVVLRLIESLNNHISFNGFKTIIKSLLACNTEQRLINRLHFSFLLITLCFIFTFSAFKPRAVTIQVVKPTLSRYKDLIKDCSYSLQCSCSQISIAYEAFLNIEPCFHDLCSSPFISDEWIRYTYGDGRLSSRFSFYDYRYSAPGQFLSLASLCRLSREKVNRTLSQMHKSYFIHSQLLSDNALIEQVEIILNRLESTASNSFLSIFNSIRDIIGSNMIMSAWVTNWEYFSESALSYSTIVRTIPMSYGECNCGLSFKCTQPSGDMMSGCYALESILQTKLYCFYDQNCIDSNGNFTKLNISNLETSQFNLNSTILSIFKNVMMEEYKSVVSYENYFNQCRPLSCSYSYIKTHDAIEPIMSLIALYGGLTIITSCLGISLVKIYQHKKGRINPGALQQII